VLAGIQKSFDKFEPCFYVKENKAFAARDIEEGEYVGEYVGDVTCFEPRGESFQLDGGGFIDAQNSGSGTEYFPHQFPNTDNHFMSDENSLPCLVISAARRIKVEEVISMDHGRLSLIRSHPLELNIKRWSLFLNNPVLYMAWNLQKESLGTKFHK